LTNFFNITLKTTEKLSKDDLSAWFKTVKDKAPAGTVIRANNIKEPSKPSALIIRQNNEGFWFYEIPLSRHLSEEEGDVIVEKFAELFPKMDFDVSASTNELDNNIELPDGAYLDLCRSLAKQEHNSWMKDREKDGWSYGPTISITNRTHPLMRPWEQLPDKFKKIDEDKPRLLIDLLNSNGYMIVNRSEIDSLVKIMRNIA
jgi:hypothetical protein